MAIRPTATQCLILLATILAIGSLVQAQTFTVLHSFTGGGDGSNPIAGLTMDQSGSFYGTTWSGGTNDDGVVFRLSHAASGWILTPLYSFRGEPDGEEPFGGVVIGPDGSLYGTTSWGGQGHGTVYRLRPSPAACHSAICPWEETVLYTFTGSSDGGDPGYGNLVFDQAGNLYGTACFGGENNGHGVVFEITPSNGGWTESVLWTFSEEAGGVCPLSGLAFDRAGNLYGATGSGGTYGAGTVYELSPSGSGWTEQTLASIDFPNTTTCGGVAMDSHGNLFGTSGCQSPGYPGGVFELTPSASGWTFNALYTFTPSGYNEGPDDTPTLDSAGNVYGTSTSTGLYGFGEAFTLTLSDDGWNYNSFSFDLSNGGGPSGSVVLDAAGNIYGTTNGGGTHGAGTVWEITP